MKNEMEWVINKTYEEWDGGSNKLDLYEDEQHILDDDVQI